MFQQKNQLVKRSTSFLSLLPPQSFYGRMSKVLIYDEIPEKFLLDDEAVQRLKEAKSGFGCKAHLAGFGCKAHLVGTDVFVVNLQDAHTINGTAVHVEEYVASKGRYRCTYTDGLGQRRVIGVKRLNLALSHPDERHPPKVRNLLTDDEKERLLECGRFGELAGAAAWRLLAHSIKFKHGHGSRSDGYDDYPFDWPQMVNAGELYGLTRMPARQTVWSGDRLRVAVEEKEWPGEPPSGNGDDDWPHDDPWEAMQRREEKRLVDAAFSNLEWPSYEDAKCTIFQIDMHDALVYDTQVHGWLKELWESAHAVEVIELLGRRLADKGGLQLMQTTWYSYQKVQLCMFRNKGWCDRAAADTWHLLKLDLNKHWNGIGGWMN